MRQAILHRTKRPFIALNSLLSTPCRESQCGVLMLKVLVPDACHDLPTFFACRFVFGQDISATFRQVNGIDLIMRAHQMVMDGYQMAHEEQVVTVFSAPNYCYRCGNKACLVEVSECLEKTFLQFDRASVAAGNGGIPEGDWPEIQYALVCLIYIKDKFTCTIFHQESIS